MIPYQQTVSNSVSTINNSFNAPIFYAVDYPDDTAIVSISYDRKLLIEYTTEPVDVDKFKVAVLALISLLYDGITDAEQWNTVLYKYLHNYLPL